MRTILNECQVPAFLRAFLLTAKALAFVFLLLPHQAAFAQNRHNLPLVMSASNPVQQGFVRIINHSDRAGSVQIHAIDDSGRRFGPISSSLAANTSVHFNSDDLESGNSAKGLSGGVGDGEGDWRLELYSDLDIEALAYIRTTDGFLTSMHDLVMGEGLMRFDVPIFNPASNLAQMSFLRIVNTAQTSAAVAIDGVDDKGSMGANRVEFTLPAGEARKITAQQLEFGGSDLGGGFGDGKGKWHLSISSDRPLQVMNLLRSPTGHLANLSSTTSAKDCDKTVASVSIPDPGLRTSLESALGKAAGEPISSAELGTLTALDARRRDIAILVGLECALGLTDLNLANNRISDLSPLSRLGALTKLGLWNNDLADLAPLSRLFALRWLNLWGTSVSDLSPLSGLAALTFLELGNNRISNVAPLAGLTALMTLDIDQNLVMDVSPLSGLTALMELELAENQISDIAPLLSNPGLGEGDVLTLTNNPLSLESRSEHIATLRARGVDVTF